MDSVSDFRKRTASEETALAGAINALGTREFLTRLLDWMRVSVPFRGCLITLLNGRRSPLHIFDNVRVERRAEVVDRYLDGAYVLDPFFTLYLNEKPCGVYRLQDVAPDLFRQSTYCREYYNSIRLKDELAILVDLPNGSHLFYSLGRLLDESRFSARDKTQFERILPVLAALNRRHFQAGGFQPEASSLDEDAIDHAMANFEADHLTDREREIAILILKGHSSKSIAAQTNISSGTVKIHRKNIYRKLEISSQSELFARFLSALTSR